VIPFPGCVINAYLQAIDRAETLCGHPPNAGEISALLVQENSWYTPMKKCPPIMAVIMNLFREDLLYTDKIIGRYSIHKREGFMTFSDFHKKHHLGYKIDYKT